MLRATISTIKTSIISLRVLSNLSYLVLTTILQGVNFKSEEKEA